MKKIEIEVPEGKRAEWVNGVLTLVDDKPKDVTDRIKTFDDAYSELGEEHPLVKEWRSSNFNISPDLEAYLKLRIICAALNEGWEPKFSENEERFYPWCWLYTQEEIDEMGKQSAKERNMVDTSQYRTEYAGLACASSGLAPSDSIAHFGSRLCLKSENLAKYCGKQFIYLWADYLLIRK